MLQTVLNLHNHTPFSDGAYTIDEIVEAHLDLGVTIDGVGISDHLFATPSSRETKSEKDFEKLFKPERRQYVEMVREAQQRWADKVTIYCGAEINWPLNRQMLPAIMRMLDGVDYVMFEYVDWAGLTQLANQAKRFPCPVGLAHARISEQFPNTSIDQVVRTMANARLFYEVNSKLLPLATDDPWFKQLPNHRVRVSIGTDTHDDLACLRDIAEIAEYLDQMGLGEKLFVPKNAAVGAAEAAQA